jgi:hypothetical protein
MSDTAITNWPKWVPQSAFAVALITMGIRQNSFPLQMNPYR